MGILCLSGARLRSWMLRLMGKQPLWTGHQRPCIPRSQMLQVYCCGLGSTQFVLDEQNVFLPFLSLGLEKAQSLYFFFSFPGMQRLMNTWG